MKNNWQITRIWGCRSSLKAVLFLAVGGVLIFFGFQKMVGFTPETGVLATTAVLIFWYSWETMRLAELTKYQSETNAQIKEEMAKARRLEFLPVLTIENAQDLMPNSNFVISKVKNIGRGVAFLDAVYINGNLVKISPIDCAIVPDQEMQIVIDNPHKFFTNGDQNSLSFVYKSIFGRSMTSSFKCNYIGSSMVGSIFYPSMQFKFGEE